MAPRPGHISALARTPFAGLNLHDPQMHKDLIQRIALRCHLPLRSSAGNPHSRLNLGYRRQLNSGGLFHSGQEIDERLVGEIETNETEPRIIEIEDHIDGECLHDRKCDYVKPDMAYLGVGQHMPG